MLFTFETAHFETSLLNADAALNAVQSFKNNNTKRGKRDEKRNNISDIVCYNKMEKYIKYNTKGEKN